MEHTIFPLTSIGPWHFEAIGAEIESCRGAAPWSPTYLAWPVANRAIYYPFRLFHRVTVTRMFFRIRTQNGNFDVGIYNSEQDLLISSGSTAAAFGYNWVNITDTILGPGKYYCACVCDNAINEIYGAYITNLETAVAGCAEEAGAFPLPDPATFAHATGTWVPGIWMSFLPRATW